MQDDWNARLESAVRSIRRHSPRPVVGCAEADVVRLQDETGSQLPPAYAMFLKAVGKDCGDFLYGSDICLGVLDEVRRGAIGLLEDCHGPALPDNAFVFCSHQGYQFLFFCLTEDPDPPVYYYLEGERDFRMVSASFSEWLTGAVGDFLAELADGATPSVIG